MEYRDKVLEIMLASTNSVIPNWSDGHELSIAASALIEHVAKLREGRNYHAVTAIGGPIGSAVLSHAVSVLSGLAGGEANLKWFVANDYGVIQGAELTSEDYVILTDNKVNLGRDLAMAYQSVTATGATVEFVAPMLDMGLDAIDLFDANVYFPVITFDQLCSAPRQRAVPQEN